MIWVLSCTLLIVKIFLFFCWGLVLELSNEFLFCFVSLFVVDYVPFLMNRIELKLRKEKIWRISWGKILHEICIWPEWKCFLKHLITNIKISILKLLSQLFVLILRLIGLRIYPLFFLKHIFSQRFILRLIIFVHSKLWVSILIFDYVLFIKEFLVSSKHFSLNFLILYLWTKSINYMD